MAEPEQLAQGWIVSGKDIYHFAQVDPSWAEEKAADQQHLIYAVEIIRQDSADGETPATYHLTYYAFGFLAALAIAAKARIASDCDLVLTIRQATAEEYLQWREVYEHARETGTDEMLSEEEVAELVRRSKE